MATIAPAVRWIEVPPAVLHGEGLQPYRPGEIDRLSGKAEPRGAESRHSLTGGGRLLIDVAAREAGTVDRPHGPGDEIVMVLDGALELTTTGTGDDAGDETSRELRIEAGEAVLIPAGWAGRYRMLPEGRWFRELAILPHDYFDPALRPGRGGHTPLAITLHDGPGRHEVHSGRYVVAIEYLLGACEWTVRAVRDEIVAVIAGSLTLKTDGSSRTFGPGSVLALPMGFTGAAEASAGYRALTAHWLG